MKIFSTNKSKLFQWQKIINKERKSILSNKSAWSYVNSFSKIITILWLRCWVLTVLASLVLSCINKGDALVLQWVNDNVVRIGEAILPFYFCTKCIENVAQGIEKHRYEMKMDNSDSDNKPIE